MSPEARLLHSLLPTPTPYPKALHDPKVPNELFVRVRSVSDYVRVIYTSLYCKREQKLNSDSIYFSVLLGKITDS